MALKSQTFARTVSESEIPDILDYLKDMPPNSTIRRLIERDGLRCHWCLDICDPRRRPSADLFPTKDHVIRKADGGSSHLHNLVVACRRCNTGRHHPNWKAKGRS